LKSPGKENAATSIVRNKKRDLNRDKGGVISFGIIDVAGMRA